MNHKYFHIWSVGCCCWNHLQIDDNRQLIGEDAAVVNLGSAIYFNGHPQQSAWQAVQTVVGLLVPVDSSRISGGRLRRLIEFGASCKGRGSLHACCQRKRTSSMSVIWLVYRRRRLPHHFPRRKKLYVTKYWMHLSGIFPFYQWLITTRTCSGVPNTNFDATHWSLVKRL